MSFIPKPHEIYKHFKGNLYQVMAVAEHTETGEQLVVYQALYGDLKAYARPLSMFTGRVDREKYPDAEQEFRFQLQGPEAWRQAAESETEGRDACGSIVGEQSADSYRSAVMDSAAFRQETDMNRNSSGMNGKAGSVAEGGEPAGLSETADSEEEFALDPMLLEFLDSDSYEQKLNILAGLHHRITDEMITTMAIACDIEISDGEIEERYEALKTCLLTLEHYECNRLR